ncbi:HAD family hydrolase [Streptomyces sp. NPDC050560]|uniref:HAD family hydrolase n=1 Tax=Streptomyces sp. NPDC050560 TaxID=3365630 RepID=UPI0037BC8B5B
MSDTTAARPVVAFFDADETLTAMKGLFELLRHHIAASDPEPASYDRRVEPLRRFAAAGGSAAEVNAKYFALLAGTPFDQVMAEGRDWFGKLRAGGVPYIDATVRALRAHQEAGHLTVVVSGSWLPCLQPVADDLGIDRVLCTRPETDAEGRLTGRVAHAMFGAHKAAAAFTTMAAHRAAPEDCYAYADDAGDLDLLGAVGNAAVVGENPAVLAVARERRWPELSAAPVAGTRRLHA